MKASENKKIKIFTTLSVFLAAFFSMQNADAKIVINEIMIGDANSSKNEFIELYNDGESAVSLDRYKLAKKTASGSEGNLVSSAKFSGIIPAKGYFVIAHPDYSDEIKADLSYSGASYSIAENNTVLLYDNAGNILDLVGYGTVSVFETAAASNPEKGKSIGRLNGEDSDDNSADFTKQEQTPGAENKIMETVEKTEYEINELDIVIKIKKDKKIYRGMKSHFEAEISEKNGTKFSLNRRGKKYEYDCFAGENRCQELVLKFTWEFGDKRRSYLLSTEHKYEEVGTYYAKLTVKGGKKRTTINFKIDVEKVPHPKVKIVKINANPYGKDAESETITLKNESKKKINLKGWSIATGWEKLVNHPIKEDFEIKAGKEKEITRELSKFTLNNKKAKIELRYPDGETADKVKYKKKEGTIKEGEIYAKVKKKWKWLLETKEEKLNARKTDTKSNLQVASSIINRIGIKNIEKEKQAEEIEVEEKNQFYNSKIMKKEKILLGKIEFESLTFGFEEIREIENKYRFMPIYPTKEHYIILFFKEIFFRINSKLNFIFNYF